jgi:sorting nexin-25
MDRKNRSLLVQFWLTVESFKAPLETVDSDSSGEEDDPIHNPTAASTVVEDISMVKDLYFSSVAPHPALASIPRKHSEMIRSFSATEAASSPPMQRKVRRSVMLSQKHVERVMQQDFEGFQRSELWFRVMSDSDFAGRKDAQDLSGSFASQSPSRLSSPPPSVKQSRPVAPQLLHRSNSDNQAAFSSLITTSASSTKSNSSSIGPQSFRTQTSNLEALMFPSGTTSDSSRAPLFGDEDEKLDATNTDRIDAIQAALTDIIALDKEEAEEHIATQDRHPKTPRPSVTFSEPLPRNKRRAVFSDAYEDAPDTEEDHFEEHNEHPAFQTAGPGDLQLTYEITRLGEKIASLESQNAMLDTLIRKAELTGDTQELRLLTKSKGSMNRELRELTFQKTQYEQQESANKLVSDRTKVSIVSSTMGEEEGKSVVRYLVEIQQLAPDGAFTSGWVVARRYNEFLSMHNKLKDQYALVRHLDFPGKRLVTALTGNSMDTRKIGLEKYLQSLITIPAVCASIELRTFLSRDSPFIASRGTSDGKGPTSFSGTDLVRTAFKSVADSIDDIFFGPPMLDVMIQRLTRQAAEFAGIVGSAVDDEDLVARTLQSSGKTAPEAALMQLSSDLKPLEGESSTSTFSGPICDLILAVFELHKQNNWLRRQAIVIILQQVLGGTIERKVRETVKSTMGPAQIMTLLTMFRDSLWPGGQFRPSAPARTAEEKMHTRDEANRKLSSLIPDLAANMIGRSNARRGARRIFAVLQNRRLNQHVAYMLVDEIFSALFPEAIVPIQR